VESKKRGQAGLGFRETPANLAVQEVEYVTGLYIAQVSESLGVSSTMIRRWEALGFIEPMRLPSGFRLYSTKDLERLRRIRDLVRSGLNPEGVRRALAQDPCTTLAQVPSVPSEAVCIDYAGLAVNRCGGWRNKRGLALLI